jgi:hypothetical protein
MIRNAELRILFFAKLSSRTIIEFSSIEHSKEFLACGFEISGICALLSRFK